MLNINLTEGVSDYQTERLTQWDSDQVLQISGVTYETTPAVHFANKKSDKALVVTPTVSSGVLTVDIPNSLLRQPYPIVAYIYSYDNDSGSTDLGITIPIIPRVQPDDYVFTGDKGLLTLAAINAKVDTLISESTTKVNNLIDNGNTRLNSLITTKTQELDTLKSTKSDELDALKTAKTEEIDNLIAAKEKELNGLLASIEQDGDDLISSKTTEIDNLIQAKTAELDNLKSEKETALSDLISTKTQALDDLQTSKTEEIDTLISDKTEELDTLKSTKETELDAVANQFIADVNANVTHDNLLINGNFAINQRGGTVYPNTNTWKCSVDRWKYIGLMTVTAKDYGTVTLAKENNADATYFVQSLDRVLGGNCVLSFEITAIDGTLAVYIEGGDGEIQTYTEPGTYSIQSTQGASAVVFRLDGETTVVVLAWAKLEHGLIVTPFYPRPYTEELRLCHYYYQVYNTAPIRAFSSDNTKIYFGFILIDPIRKGAAFTMTGLLNASAVEMARTVTGYHLNETTLVNITFDSDVGTSGAYLSFNIDAEVYE